MGAVNSCRAQGFLLREDTVPGLLGWAGTGLGRSVTSVTGVPSHPAGTGASAELFPAGGDCGVGAKRVLRDTGKLSLSLDFSPQIT